MKLYRTRRLARSLVTGLYSELTSTPKKTLFDVITGLPIAALVVPSFREWLFARPWGGTALLVLVAVRLLFSAWRRGRVKKLVKDEVAYALKSMGAIIQCSQMQAETTRDGQPSPEAQVRQNVVNVLTALANLTERVLGAGEKLSIQTNLMVPMTIVADGEPPSKAQGYGIVSYDAIPPSPSWTRLQKGDMVAGQVFETGKIQVVEDVNDPCWCGVFEPSRAKCFVSFPILSQINQVIAVINIDSSRAMVITRKNAKDLFVILSPPLALVSELLRAASTGFEETITS
jgi:hypothetical protein